jgi:hexosaminidase
VAESGASKLYVDFLKQIYAVVQPLHKRMLFWGDIAMDHAESVKTLPKDVIAVAWEYGPRPEGFEKWLRFFLLSDAKFGVRKFLLCRLPYM